jgi:hypothetical protein
MKISIWLILYAFVNMSIINPNNIHNHSNRDFIMCSQSNLQENRCTGSASCNACTDCSRCGYCNNGGSCGVCGGGYVPNVTLPQLGNSVITPSKSYDFTNYNSPTKSYSYIFNESINKFYNRDKVKKVVPSDKHWWVYKIIGTTGDVNSWEEKAQKIFEIIHEDPKIYKQYREEDYFIKNNSNADYIWCYDSNEQVLCYNKKSDSEYDLQRPIGIWIFEYNGKAPENYINIGKLQFWTTNPLYLPIKISVDNRYVGTITKSYSNNDVIWSKSEGTVLTSLKTGQHTWEAQLNNGDKRTKIIYLDKRENQLINID